jgi:hypothetical protein
VSTLALNLLKQSSVQLQGTAAGGAPCTCTCAHRQSITIDYLLVRNCKPLQDRSRAVVTYMWTRMYKVAGGHHACTCLGLAWPATTVGINNHATFFVSTRCDCQCDRLTHENSRVPICDRELTPLTTAACNCAAHTHRGAYQAGPDANHLHARQRSACARMHGHRHDDCNC